MNLRSLFSLFSSDLAIDPTKTTRELAWRPSVQFESGLRKTVRWYLDHADWIENLRTGAYRDWIERNYAARPAL